VAVQTGVVRFGVNIPNYGPGTTPETLGHWARRAEEVGYHLVMLSDHVALTPDVVAGFPAPFYEPFTTLAWLAGITRDVELGTTVTLLPYRHPLLTARMAAGIDQLSGGRLVLGVGAGWAEGEFAALGVPYRERGAITDEHLAAIKTLWMHENAGFEGKHVSFRKVRTEPRPFRRPHPPVWVGGSSPPALRRAALLGDAWHPSSVSADWLTEVGLPRPRHAAHMVDRPVPDLAPRIKLRITRTPIQPPERLLGEGSLDQIRRDIELLEALGATHVVLDTLYPGEAHRGAWQDEKLAALEAMATDVIDAPRGTLR
jgi:probable F420-dependent oxidoreductase